MVCLPMQAVRVFYNLCLLLSLLMLSSSALSVAEAKPDVTSDVEDGGEDDVTDVMSPECQDPLLALTYLSLPLLP